VEIKQRYREEDTCYPLGLDWAYVLSCHSYAELCAKTEDALADMAKGRESDCVEQVVFTALAATGVISGIARGSNQCALAHKFYETTTSLFHEEARPYLHGEIVGIGLLLQNRFNGETERNGDLLSLMERYGMPHCITDIGIPRTEQAMAEYADRLKNSSAIEKATRTNARDWRRPCATFGRRFDGKPARPRYGRLSVCRFRYCEGEQPTFSLKMFEK
jgi:glycerol dehydrogenase-like iron-containing ADH family enzyme